VESITSFLTQYLGPVMVVLALVAIVALVVALGNASRIRSIAGRFAWVTGDGVGSPDTLETLLRTVQSNQRTIGVINSTLERVVEDGKTHMRRMGLVRYDAFEGIAGHQSFSLCLLDDHHNGVLISSLVGREFSRSYAVEIKGGTPSRKLGDEETAALSEALRDHE
jgi:hypothetical protein